MSAAVEGVFDAIGDIMGLRLAGTARGTPFAAAVLALREACDAAFKTMAADLGMDFLAEPDAHT